MSLPTVKLSLAEWTSLITALVLEIGEDAARAVMVEALGEERASKLIVERSGEALSKKDNHAIVRALYPRIPGSTRTQKEDWLIEKGRAAFGNDDRFLEVLAFVRDRVEAFEAAGGSLDTYVEVVDKEEVGVPDSSDIPVGTRFLHTDVSAWPATSALHASVSGGQIRLDYDKARVWPAVDGANANPWVLANVGGTWYAATFEWFRAGQTNKPVGVLDGSMGDHIKRAPLSSWHPRKGERVGFMVSGLARSSTRNVKERTLVCWLEWPL